MNTKTRHISQAKCAWWAACMAMLVGLGLVFLNLQAVWASATEATQTTWDFHLMSEYPSVNENIEKMPGEMRVQEAEIVELRGTEGLGKLDFGAGKIGLKWALDWVVKLQKPGRLLGMPINFEQARGFCEKTIMVKILDPEKCELLKAVDFCP